MKSLQNIPFVDPAPGMVVTEDAIWVSSDDRISRLDKSNGKRLDGAKLLTRMDDISRLVRVGELIAAVGFLNGMLVDLFTMDGRHVCGIGLPWFNPFGACAVGNNQLAITGRFSKLFGKSDQMIVLRLRPICSISMLLGLHSRCGEKSILMLLSKTSGLFEPQTLRLIWRLAGAWFRLK